MTLIRQGEGQAGIHRHHTELAAHQMRLEQIINLALEVDATIPTGHAGGDNQRLRGIPAIGIGVQGHIPGTRPDRLDDIRLVR
jgi:hypothetical protein